MSTATKQTTPASLNSPFVSDNPDDQSTLGVVQKLQQKLRNTRENLERLRIDPAAESDGMQPHLITEKIANQLRLVNKERLEVLQQLGSNGNEKLRDVVARMQQEMDQLRKQNEDLRTHSSSARPAPNAPMLEQPIEKQTAPQRMPFQSTLAAGANSVAPRAKTVLEQEMARKQQEHASRSTAQNNPAMKGPRIPEAAYSNLELEDLLSMLNAGSLEEGMQKLQEMRDLCEQYPVQKESLLSKNKELTAAVKKMHADQLALCKRFNVNSLSEMARLIMETMDIKKQNGQRVTQEVNSWVAVADLLQDWDRKIHTDDPNHTVKVERVGSRWNLSANWQQM
ncbi:MAG: hypothetical protein R3C11_01650 [Planctomycetaceae bacterium]